MMMFLDERCLRGTHADASRAQGQRTAHLRASGIIFVTPDRKALFLKRADDGTWNWPAGGLEDDETPEEAARREALEEIGPYPEGNLVQIETCVSEAGIEFTTFYQEVDAEFEPVLNDEHTDWVWREIDARPDPLHPGVAKTLERFPSLCDATPNEVRVTLPLFIRLLEWAREDAETDLQLHEVAERLAACSGLVDIKGYNRVVKDSQQALGFALSQTSSMEGGMPLTEKGTKILAAMKKQYGEKKGESVFYASKNAGKISGVDADDAFEWDADTKEYFANCEGKTFMKGSAAKDKKVRDKSDREKSGKEPDDREWELAGPLSDAKVFVGSPLVINTDAWSEEARRAAAESRKQKQKAHREEFERKTARRYPLEPKSERKEEKKDSLPTLSLGDAYAVNSAELTHIEAYDAIELNDTASNVRFTDDGYLVAQPRIARTGIQLYKGSECGKPEMDVVRVYRPEAEVFHRDAWKTYTHLPMTLEHPKGPVNPGNWKDLAIGETSDEVLRDGQSVRVPLMLRDAAAIKAYKSGEKQQLSLGYNCDLAWQSGVAPNGEKFDAIQRNIRCNHLALVGTARGGASLRIGDSSKEISTLSRLPPIVLTTDAWSEEARRAALEARKRKAKGASSSIASSGFLRHNSLLHNRLTQLGYKTVPGVSTHETATHPEKLNKRHLSQINNELAKHGYHKVTNRSWFNNKTNNKVSVVSYKLSEFDPAEREHFRGHGLHFGS